MIHKYIGGKKMVYIKEYWEDKDNRAEHAKKHTEDMERIYGKNIRETIKNTIIYDVDFKSSKDYLCETEIVIEATDSVSAVMKYADKSKKHMAVLNFSSYKNPGGGFVSGSKAQEECLCHESYLYNVLKEFVPTFYDWNNKNKNRAMYLNRGLYSQDIMFFKDEKSVLCDVITCAAPNKSAAQRYQRVTDNENTKVLKERIRFVLDIAKENNVDLLILGAYGCGVFGQNATEVAQIFKEYLETTHKCFEKVIFAIPKGRDKNFEVFEKVFG